MIISFVIPVYNRREIISDAINSVLDILKECSYKNIIEIIIVDDASQDNVVDFILDKYGDYINENLIKVFSLEINLGVTGAKNYGASVSKGEWIIFLDSDDLLISNNFKELKRILVENNNMDVVFFSCVDFNGERVGEEFYSKELMLDDYLRNGTYGEKLPVIKTEVINQFKYHTDLRGFESLTYLEMILSGKRFYVSELVCRKYRMDNEDRLSNISNRLVRSGNLSIGFWRVAQILLQHKKTVPISVFFKILVYGIISLVLKLKNKIKQSSASILSR